MLSLGNRIKKSRERAGFTQEHLAEAIGVTRSAIAQYESGEREPTIQHFADIARVLHVSADYLLGLPQREGVLPIGPGAQSALLRFIKELEEENGL